MRTLLGMEVCAETEIIENPVSTEKAIAGMAAIVRPNITSIMTVDKNHSTALRDHYRSLHDHR